MSATTPATSAGKLYCLAVLVPPYAIYKIDVEAESSGQKSKEDVAENDAVAMNMLLTLLGILPGIAHALIQVRSHIRLRRTAAPPDPLRPSAPHARSSTSSSQALLSPSAPAARSAAPGQASSPAMSQMRVDQTTLATTASSGSSSIVPVASTPTSTSNTTMNSSQVAAPPRVTYVRVPSVMYCPVLNKEGGAGFGYEDRRVATMV